MASKCEFTLLNVPHEDGTVVAFVESGFGVAQPAAVPRIDGPAFDHVPLGLDFTVGCFDGLNRIHTEIWYPTDNDGEPCGIESPWGLLPTWCEFDGALGVPSNTIEVEGTPIPEPGAVVSMWAALVTVAWLRRWWR